MDPRGALFANAASRQHAPRVGVREKPSTRRRAGPGSGAVVCRRPRGDGTSARSRLVLQPGDPIGLGIDQTFTPARRGPSRRRRPSAMGSRSISTRRPTRAGGTSFYALGRRDSVLGMYEGATAGPSVDPSRTRCVRRWAGMRGHHAQRAPSSSRLSTTAPVTCCSSRPTSRQHCLNMTPPALFGSIRFRFFGVPRHPRLSVSGATVLEGDSGLSTATFTVSLSEPDTVGGQVSYSTADGTASDGVDYVAASGTVGFAPGDVAESIPVSVFTNTRSGRPFLRREPGGREPGPFAFAQSTGTIVLDDDTGKTLLSLYSQPGGLHRGQQRTIRRSTGSSPDP